MHIDLENAILLFVVLIISLTTHEAAHALLAKIGGDLTAYQSGQVTLNPLPHIRREPFGMVVLPLLAIFASGGTSTMGFAHAPVDPVWAHHHPKKAALMSAAGPLSNLLLAMIAFAVLYYIGRPHSREAEAVRRIAGTFLLLNLLLAMLNVLPLPPLDGHGVVSGLFPRTKTFYRRLAELPGFGIAVLLLIVWLLPQAFWPVYAVVTRQLPYPYWP